MDTNQEAEWPDEFTREEMLEQQSLLLIEECHMLQKELSRCRKNMEKLVDLHDKVSIERDKIREEFMQTSARLSDCLHENSFLKNEIGGLRECREQLEAIHKAKREESHQRVMEARANAIGPGKHP